MARALESDVPVRALSPLRRAAGSLAVAAAMVLAAGGAAALAGCSDAAKPEPSGRSGRDRSSREDRSRSTAEKRASDSPLDDLVDAVGDFVNPPTTPADDVRRTPTPPSSEAPRPAGTTVPTYDPPRPAGSVASPPPSPPVPRSALPRPVVAS